MWLFSLRTGKLYAPLRPASTTNPALFLLLARSASARAAELEQAGADLEVREQQLASREGALAKGLRRLQQQQEMHTELHAALQAQQVGGSRHTDTLPCMTGAFLQEGSDTS